MFKYFSFLFLYLSLIQNLFSQEITITTEFSQNGNLYENPSDNSQTLTEFRENEECTIVDYLGNDVYKINYKQLLGFVKAEYLFVNDNMIELVIDYEDKIKIEAIEKEKMRKQEVDALIAKSEKEKQRQEALELKRKNEESLNKKLEDSIAKVRTEEKQNQEALELKKKSEEELNKRREDSIVKIREEIKKKEEGLLIKKREEILKKAKEDSVFIASQEKEIENEVPEKSEFRSVCHYSIDEFDQFYGIRIVRTSPYTLAKNLMVELYRQAQRTNVFFNLSEDLGCSSYIPSNRSSVKVMLENDTVVTFYHSWDIDCGNFSFKGNLSNSDIEKLKKSSIKSIRLKGTEGFYEITNVDYKEFFIDKLKCIE
ncbi:SH3 domain-containing protein [Confluentibacter lentus]|uniref:SH3 domain-containing protein n=1 Tax=Confluentibacter lentus TaxID=1699412 RepID=UPI000C281370|nr:SH3 domain-containing protein [Confluentibacter lentus]